MTKRERILNLEYKIEILENKVATLEDLARGRIITSSISSFEIQKPILHVNPIIGLKYRTRSGKIATIEEIDGDYTGVVEDSQGIKLPFTWNSSTLSCLQTKEEDLVEQIRPEPYGG